MGDLFELLADRVVEFLLAVTVHVAPQRGNPVEIFSSMHVDQVIAVAAADDAGLFAHPFLHLRERMPEIRVVQLF